MDARSMLIVFCGALAGCSDAVTDAQWAKTVPGVYEGSQFGFVERVDLKTDGSFQHNVSVGGKSLISESGKWTFDVERGMVSVGPFTSFWDAKSRRLTTNIVSSGADELSVMRYGKAAERISSVPDFAFQLFKKRTNSTP